VNFAGLTPVGLQNSRSTLVVSGVVPIDRR
jgi:hypothetical protein